MRLINNGIIKFDYQFPIYNFFFPNQTYNQIDGNEDAYRNIFGKINENIISRALYFHIPFCESICTFCPFTKGLYKDQSVIDSYVEALIKEIRYKSQFISYKDVPIKAIFFGGGTPSLLSPKNIIDIGAVIHEYFNLTQLKEFSFEMNLKSVTAERIDALRKIGVTHPRFGLQTFDPEWRDIFNLTEATGKIEESTALLTASFDHVLCDLMYGMNGQDEDVIISDIDKAIRLGLTNIDIYPINNVVTPPKLHKLIKRRTDDVTSATRKLSMSLLIDSHMRQSGFMPHNGHGYVKASRVSDAIVTSEYSFGYHEHVYGYADHDFIGFGVNAISSLRGYVITNETGRERYITAMNKGEYLCKISQHDPLLDEMKPIILRLPYHGEVDKTKVNINSIPTGLRMKLDELIQAGLISEDSDTMKLTKTGWLWYTNIMFYLMPEIEQKILKKIVHEELKVPGRFISEKELLYVK